MNPVARIIIEHDGTKKLPYKLGDKHPSLANYFLEEISETMNRETKVVTTTLIYKHCEQSS